MVMLHSIFHLRGWGFCTGAHRRGGQPPEVGRRPKGQTLVKYWFVCLFSK